MQADQVVITSPTIFLRFYFRFIAPNRDEASYHPNNILASIEDQLRAFVGVTAFEELCREWIRVASNQGKLAAEVKQIGSHWSRLVQVDVVGINWQTRSVLIGECKWGTDRVAREVVTELIEKKTPLLLQSLPDDGAKWKVHFVF